MPDDGESVGFERRVGSGHGAELGNNEGYPMEKAGVGTLLGSSVGFVVWSEANVGKAVGWFVTEIGAREKSEEGKLVKRVTTTLGTSVIGAALCTGVGEGAFVGSIVGERLSPSISRRIESKRPVVSSSANASTYSASASKCCAVHPAEKYSAKAPETIGAAMEVPDLVKIAVSDVIPAAKISRPGAQILMHAPVLLDSARTSPSPMLATAMTPGTRAGDRSQEFVL